MYIHVFMYIHVVKFVLLTCMVCIFVCCFLYHNLLQLTLVEGLLLPLLYIHTYVIFNKCIQTLKKIQVLWHFHSPRTQVHQVLINMYLSTSTKYKYCT